MPGIILRTSFFPLKWREDRRMMASVIVQRVCLLLNLVYFIEPGCRMFSSFCTYIITSRFVPFFSLYESILGGQSPLFS